jgi:outer membrane protein
MIVSRFLAASAAFALAAAVAVPVAGLAQMRPATMPTPVPTPAPNNSPLPYPAYGSPAPDVEAMTPHSGVPAIITLTQATKIAVALSPAFANENAEYAAIHAKFTSEKQALFPALSGTAQAQNNYGQSTTFSGGTAAGGSSATIGGKTTSEGATFTLTQLIYDGGRVIAAIHQSKRADIAGEATLLRQLQTLQLNVATAYYGVLQDNASVTANAQLVREFEINEDAVRAQIRNGAAARSDLANAQFQTAQARGVLVTAQGAAIGAQATFATTIGLDADTLVVPKTIKNEGNGTNPTYATSLQRALLLRPDYIAAQYTVWSAQDGVAFAKLARSPSLSFGAGSGWARQFPTVSTTCNSANGSCLGSGSTTNTVTQPFAFSSSLGLTLSIPIYDQGQTNYNVALAASQLDQAKAQLIQTHLQVESDVRSGLANLISARANLVQAISEQEAAQVSLDAAQAQYKVGAATILTLVTAEANLATAVSTYITSLYGVHTAEDTYLYAVGTSDLQL